MSATLNNPFVVSGYKGREYFCDRHTETGALINALENERNVTLVSPRRMGKTGLILHSFEEIKRRDSSARCLYLDLLPTTNLAQFVDILAKGVVGLMQPTESFFQKLRQTLGALRPMVTFDGITGQPSVTFDIRSTPPEQSLTQIFECLRQMGRRCYIALDEFQQITNYPEKGVEALLRSHIQFLPNVYFIFSGSERHMMEEMFLSSMRPFFHSTQLMELGPIPAENYLDFANGFFAVQGRSLATTLFGEIYTRCNAVTWYMQSVLSRIYNYKSAPIDSQLIDTCFADILSEQEVYYKSLLGLLTANQRKVMRAVAREGDISQVFAADFIQRHHLPAVSSVRTVVNALLDKQLLTRTDGRLHIPDPFLTLWLRSLPDCRS